MPARCLGQKWLGMVVDSHVYEVIFIDGVGLVFRLVGQRYFFKTIDADPFDSYTLKWCRAHLPSKVLSNTQLLFVGIFIVRSKL